MRIRIINIIALSVLSAAVIGLIAYSFSAGQTVKEYQQSEALSREAVFEGLVSSAEKLNAGMIKLSVSNDPKKTGELLSEIRRDAAEAAAQVDLAAMGEKDRRELEAFLNVTGDHAHALERKLQQEGTLAPEDRRQLQEIGRVMREISEKLRYAREHGYSPELEIDEFFAEQQQTFAPEEYPRLIYHGPFSESVMEREPAGLPDYDVTEQKALKTAEAFAGCELSPVAHTDGAVLPFYHFESGDGNVRVSVTKQGGEVLYYKNALETDGLSIIPTDARIREVTETAEDFLMSRGYGRCIPGQKRYYNGMAVMEMIPAGEGDIWLFPDLIRLWIDLQSGQVMGMDAENYLMNHRRREFPGEGLSMDEAEEKLAENLTVKERGRAVIPRSDGTEACCYGFYCETDTQEILVFLDAQTGEERDILVFVDTPNSKQTV